MIFDQTKYLSLLIKRVYLTLLSVISLLLLLVGFLATKLYLLTKAEPVYVVFPDQTFAAHRPEASLVRSEYELIAFSKLFLEKALAHHEYSWEENVNQVTLWMDPESAHMFRTKMDETVQSLYKERNAVSFVTLQEIEVNKERHPHEILMYYTTYLRFIAAGKTVYEDVEIAGGVYFQLTVCTRSHKNPYGLQIKNLKFLQAKEKKEAGTTK
jgi:hypothetical protein